MMTRAQSLGGLQSEPSAQARQQATFAPHQAFEGFPLHIGPSEIQVSADGVDIHKTNHGRMPYFLERPRQPLGDADVPHASAGHQFQDVPLLVVLGSRFVNRAHAAKADGVGDSVWSEYEVLGLALKNALGLKRREDSLVNKIIGET